MILHPLPPSGKFYCGPAALAAITGLHPKGPIRSAVNKVRGRPETRGICRMAIYEMPAVLKLLGLKGHTLSYLKPYLTVKAYAAKYPESVFIVRVSGHFIALSHGWALDSYSCVARPVEWFPGRMRKVTHAVMIFGQTVRE